MSTPTEVGRTVSATAGLTNTVAATTAIAAGRTVVLAAGTPSSTPATSWGASDPHSNSWATPEAIGNANYAPSLSVVQLATGLAAGDLVTFGQDKSCASWHLCLLDLGITGAPDVHGQTPSGATNSNPTVSSSSPNAGDAAVDHQWLIAIFENTNTTHTFTPPPGWTEIPGGLLQTGSGSGANQLHVCYFEATSGNGAVRTATGGYNTAATYAAALLAINADPPGWDYRLQGGLWVPGARYLSDGAGGWL